MKFFLMLHILESEFLIRFNELGLNFVFVDIIDEKLPDRRFTNAQSELIYTNDEPIKILDRSYLSVESAYE